MRRSISRRCAGWPNPLYPFRSGRLLHVVSLCLTHGAPQPSQTPRRRRAGQDAALRQRRWERSEMGAGMKPVCRDLPDIAEVGRIAGSLLPDCSLLFWCSFFPTTEGKPYRQGSLLGWFQNILAARRAARVTCLDNSGSRTASAS